MTTSSHRPTVEEFGVTLPEAWTAAGVRPERGTGVLLVPLGLIKDSPFQTRSVESMEAGIEELRDSLLHNGQAVPVAVRPTYTFDSDGIPSVRNFQLLNGHRRIKALKHAQLLLRAGSSPLEPGMARATIEDRNDDEAARLVVAENLARKDLSRIELARAAQQLAAAGMRQQDVANVIGVTQGAVSNMLRVLEYLPPPILDLIARSHMSFQAAMPLLNFWQEKPLNGYDYGREMLDVVRMATPLQVRFDERFSESITAEMVEKSVSYRLLPSPGEGSGSTGDLAIWKPCDAVAWKLYGAHKTVGGGRRLPTPEELDAESPGTALNFGKALGRWTYDTKAWERLQARFIREAKRKAAEDPAASSRPGRAGDTEGGSREGSEGSRGSINRREPLLTQEEIAERDAQAKARANVVAMLRAEAAKKWPAIPRDATTFILASLATGVRMIGHGYNRWNVTGAEHIARWIATRNGTEWTECPWLDVGGGGYVMDVEPLLVELEELSAADASALLYDIVSNISIPENVGTHHFTQDNLGEYTSLMRTLIGGDDLPAMPLELHPEPVEGPVEGSPLPGALRAREGQGEGEATPAATSSPRPAGARGTGAGDKGGGSREGSGEGSPPPIEDPEDLDPTTEARMLAANIGDACPFGGPGTVVEIDQLEGDPLLSCDCQAHGVEHDVTWRKARHPEPVEGPAEGSPPLGGPHLSFRIPERAGHGMGCKKTVALTFLSRTAGSDKWSTAVLTESTGAYQEWRWQGSLDAIRAEGRSSVKYADALALFLYAPPAAPASPLPSPLEGEGQGEGPPVAGHLRLVEGRPIDADRLRAAVLNGELSTADVTSLHSEGCPGFDQPYWQGHVAYNAIDHEDGSLTLACDNEACAASLNVQRPAGKARKDGIHVG
jgi:ParB/RepB/Spo0J family partition protein